MRNLLNRIVKWYHDSCRFGHDYENIGYRNRFDIETELWNLFKDGELKRHGINMFFRDTELDGTSRYYELLHKKVCVRCSHKVDEISRYAQHRLSEMRRLQERRNKALAISRGAE